MIGQRYAVPARTGRRFSQSHPSSQTRTPASGYRDRPAAAGRKLFADALARSVLIQLMLAMTFVAFAALLYLAQASQASVLDYNIAALQADRSQLNSQNANLQAGATSLRSLKRIDAAATNQLHMTKPDISSTIWIRAVLPAASFLSAPTDDPLSAQKQSQPLGWMTRLLSFLKSSL